MNFRNYSDEGVLPSSYVYSVFQDSKGYMWFSTDRGITRYDGYTFTNFRMRDGLSDHEIFNFFEDSRQRIWFYTLNGKVSFYKDGRFVNSTIDSTLRALDSNYVINGICEDSRGGIWISNVGRELLYYSPDGHAKRFLEGIKTWGWTRGIIPFGRKSFAWLTDSYFLKLQLNDKLDAIVRADTFAIRWPNDKSSPLGSPKYTMIDSGVFFVSDQKGVIKFSTNGSAPELLYRNVSTNEAVLNILLDKDYLWICTTKGVIPYSRREHRFLPRMLQHCRVAFVRPDSEGNYWFTTLGDGIFFSSSFDIYAVTTQDGLPTNRISSINADSLGRVWLGYEGKGLLTSVHNGRIQNFSLALPSLSDAVSVHKITNGSDGNLWLASSVGFFRVNNKGIDVLPFYYCRAIFERSNVLWVSSTYNAVRFRKEAFEQFKISAKLYGCAEGFLDCSKNPPVSRFNTYFKGGEVTKALFVTRSSQAWYSTDQSLYRFVGDSFEPVKLNLSVRSFVVTDFNEFRDSTMIFATNEQGVLFYKNDKLISVIGEKQGLSSNTCNAVEVDRDGTVWVGTDNGLNKISGYPGELTVEYFTANDGLLSNAIVDVSVSNDTVWVATKKGLSYFHKDRLRRKTFAPRMNIDAITVQGRNIDFSQGRSLAFEHYENDVSLRYTGLSFNNSRDILYRYKLHPEDPWQYTKNTSVYLPRLPADEYKFIVASRTNFSDWGKAVSLSFVIRKPFWQTSLFIVVVLFFVAALLWIGIEVYVRNQRKKMLWEHRITMSELRSLRAQMNPHFLFNALNAIKGAILKNDAEKAEDYINKFSRLMRLILDHSDRTTITLAEEIESIRRYIEIEQFRPNTQFEFTVDVAPSIDIQTVEIPAMILQPFVENSIIHGFSSKDRHHRLAIRFSMEDDSELVVLVEDNGIGRRRSMNLQRNGHHRSKGIQLVKERIETLNFRSTKRITLSLEDLEHEQSDHPGTRVTIKIPI